MNDLDKFDGRYRRPQPHFTLEEQPQIRPTVDKKRLLTGSALLGALALVLTLAMLPQTPPEADAQTVRQDSQSAAAPECVLIQHLTYTPCGHQMTRRQSMPAELIGQRREQVASAYDQWQLTSFAAQEIVMEQTLALPCPDHMVLLPDESGVLCVFQNRYGDALGLIRETGVRLTDLPEQIQDEVRPGKLFPTIEDAEKWLESADS